MKVIDLLNKIANAEEVPKNIFIGCKNFRFIDKKSIDNDFDYQDSDNNYLMDYLSEYWYVTDYLNKEVKIIEEDKEMEKGIKPFKEYWEEIEMAGCDTVEAKKVYLDRLSKLVIELREAVNELKKGK